MRLQILSDLHVEFGDWTPPPVESDVVVLAGDIHVKGRGVAWAKEKFPNKPVIFVPGNHDYYKGSLKHTLDKMREEAAGSNVHLLHDAAVILQGVRFVGGTLWTDYRLTGNEPLAQWDAQQQLTDFKSIRDEQFRKLRPNQIASKHAKTRAFFQEQFDQPFDGPTVVVSHHAPSELSIAEHYRDNPSHLNAAYASRLEHLMGPHVALWVHGHMHDSLDYTVNGTRVVCNPRGYAPTDINPDFNESLVCEV